MHIEIVDSLRCPSPHEETWLVASVTRFDGRDIVEGALGCPVCRRQYAVRAGEVDFTAPIADVLATTGGVEASERSPAPSSVVAPDEGGVLRARALLGLSDGGGLVLLGGERARMASALEDEAQVMPLLLNAPSWARGGGRVPSALRAIDALPVAAGALRAAWLDGATASAPQVTAVARALRRGGRLLAPVGAELPVGARELARDSHEWVAEWEGGASAPVALRRR